MILRNATPNPLLALAFAAASFCAAPSYAETDAQLMASGQWRDPATGLIWMRCSIGQTWTGSTCTGEPLKLNWQDANDYFELFNQDGFAGRKNWRLPKIQELVTIRRCSKGWHHYIKVIGNLSKDLGVFKVVLPNGRSVPGKCADESNSPTLDAAVFPNTPSRDAAWYWSATLDASDGNFAWGVRFDEFSSVSRSNGNRYSHHHVRAVRASQ